MLGLVRRDLLIEIAEAVAREDGAAVFELAGRAVESGYDLRHVIRELARLTRDLLVIGIDASRLGDPEIAAESEREALRALAAKFSPEDLMRAFDVLTKAELDVRASMQPRYQLEMALLRWIHLRRLVPLTDLIEGLEKGGSPAPRASAPARPAAPASTPAPAPAARPAAPPRADAPARPAPPRPAPPPRETAPVERPATPATPPTGAAPAPSPPAAAPARGTAGVKDALLAEIQKTKKLFYGTVIAQAQRIDVQDGPTPAASCSPSARSTDLQAAGRAESPVARGDGGPARRPADDGDRDRRRWSRAGEARRRVARRRRGRGRPVRQAVGIEAEGHGRFRVQAMLDVFGTDIKEVEEM